MDVTIDPRLYMRRSWLEPVASGFALVSQGQADLARAGALQQATEQREAEQAAIKQFGQTRNPQALMGVNPELGVKLKAWVDSQPPENLADISKASAFVTSIAPNINSKSWPGIRNELAKAYPKLPQDALPPDNATDQQLFQWANQAKILDAQLKQMQQGPKVLKGGDVLAGSGGNILARAPLTPLQEAQALKAKTGAQKDIADIQDPGRKWKPEILLPLNGKGPAVSWKPGTAVPEGYGPAKGASSSKSSEEDIDSMVQGLKEGTIVPSLLSKRAVDYNRIIARGQRQGLDLPKIQLEYDGAKRAVSSLNSPQQIRLKGYAIGVVNTIDEITALSEQLKQSGITPLNKISLDAKMKLAGNTPAGQLATKYVTAVNTLKEEFANLAQGGYAPTESVWNLANKQINENFGVDQMKASLGEIKRLINFRLKAFDEVASTTGAVRPTSGGKAPQGGPAKTMTAPDGGTATYSGKSTPEGHPIYQMPDGTFRPWTGGNE